MAVLRTPIEQEDTQLRISRSTGADSIQISGEIDAWNVGTVRQALQEALLDRGDVHLDVSRLLFCDVTGIRALVSAAANLDQGRQLVLHGLDPQLQRVFQVVGWGDMPSLVFDPSVVSYQ